MADQCIVCLDVLDVVPAEDDVAAAEVIAEDDQAGAAATISHPSNVDTQQDIAVIQTCGHILHDACLKEWTQKANSCPICRQQFNLVEVHRTTTGPIISSYTVQDKKQVAEFDPLAWIQDHDEEEEVSRPCPICGTSNDEEVLLLCDSCDAPYHTYCVGLDRVPQGQWFCMECEHDDALALARSIEPSAAFRGLRRRERTQAQVRQARSRRRNRTEAWQGAWNQISGRIYDALDLDLDFDEDHALRRYRQVQRRTERERRELQQWQQRLAIASRQGARDVFRNSARPMLTAEVEPEPPRESDEERRAWETYDRVRAGEAENGSPSRKRKSRSATQSPREQPTGEPERKLKRPRTRRVMDTAGPSTDANGESSRANGHRAPVSPARRRSPPPSTSTSAAPSFLSSLLKEVEMGSMRDEDSDNNEHYHNLTIAGSPAAEHSSPVLSPATSNYSTPRAMSLTPPPPGTKRCGSPLSLSSRVEPIYPPADYSPNRSPPAPKPENGHSHSRPTTPPAPHLRQPAPRRTHQALPHHTPPREASPPYANIPIEAKEGIQRIVKKALDPHYKKPAGITKEQYADVNRMVSRKLYERIVDPSSLDEEQKSRWEKVASAEVAKAVQGLTA